MSFGQRIEKLRSVRITLALWYSGTLVLLALLMGTFLYYRLRFNLTEEYDRFLTTYVADLGAKFTEFPPESGELISSLHDELRYFLPVHVEYRVFDEGGRAVFSSDGWADMPQPPSVPSLPSPSATVRIGDIAYKTTVSPVALADGRVWTSQTAISLERVESLLRNHERTMWVLTLPLLFGGIVGGMFLARKALRPVVRMAAAAREISSRNLSRRLLLRGTGDELDDLAGALNAMLERLEESFLRIERFSADLAHELRTPITQLVGETEAVLMSDLGESELREVLARHAEVYESMRNMTNDLLQLLRSGTAGSIEKKVTLNLQTLLEEVVESFRVLAEEKGVVLSYDHDASDAEIVCHPLGVRRMVSNLLDNAIRHTPEKGRVELVARVEGEGIMLSVTDDGEGISESDQARVFERFFRGDGSRNQSAGFGLGLSIVKRVVDEHGGTVEITSREGHGTRVDVRLPVEKREGRDEM